MQRTPHHCALCGRSVKDRPWLDSPIATLGLVAVAYAVFLGVQLSRNGFDFSVFVTAGDRFVDLAAAPDHLHVTQDSAGYDGQFYYRLALTPFTSERSALGVTLDDPAYRQQRIVYPLLGWALSFGQPGLVPVSLVLVNLAALFAIGILGSRYAQQSHLPAVWGLVFALYPGFLLVLSRDTVEIVEICFLLGAVVCLRQNRYWVATALLVLAVLTKETALVVAVGILLTLPKNYDRKQIRPFLSLAAAPILAYALWYTWLNHTWSRSPVNETAVKANIGMPFVGLSLFVRSILPPTNHFQWVWLVELLLLLCFVVAVVFVLRQSATSRHIKGSWLLYLALSITLTRAVWVEDWAFLRVLSELYALGIMILLDSRSRLKEWVFYATLASWLLLALHVIIR